MKSKHLAILFVLILISCLMSSCATIPVRKPLTEELSGVAQIPDIPRARFWSDEAPPFFEAVIDQPREKLKQAFPGIYGKAHNYLALSGGGSNGAFGAGLMVGWSAAGHLEHRFDRRQRQAGGTGVDPQDYPGLGIHTGSLSADDYRSRS